MSGQDLGIGLLTEQEAADLIGYSRETLKKWRSNDEGPPYLKLRTGSIRYAHSDLVVWATEHRIVPGGGQAA